jgi:hypothetical protein
MKGGDPVAPHGSALLLVAEVVDRNKKPQKIAIGDFFVVVFLRG